MTDDQRFASRRSDVLTNPLTLAGLIQALLQMATTGTDADWVVKIIDVYPDKTPDEPRAATSSWCAPKSSGAASARVLVSPSPS